MKDSPIITVFEMEKEIIVHNFGMSSNLASLKCDV